ncbi:uncharacterized protein [Chlorocebus sabaeus]|uniref:uncharacterized protein n=1 Tax=Chlorocebus sabaeus TaxID=60711 RepID=UPI003BF98D78
MPSLPDNTLARVRPPRRPAAPLSPAGGPGFEDPASRRRDSPANKRGSRKPTDAKGVGRRWEAAGLSPTRRRKITRCGNVAGALRRRLFPQAPAEGPAESLAGRPRGPQPCSGAEREPMQPGSIPCPSPVPGAPPASEPSTWPQGRRDHPPPIPTAAPYLPFPGPVSSPPLPPPLSGRRFGGPDRVLAGN